MNWVSSLDGTPPQYIPVIVWLGFCAGKQWIPDWRSDVLATTRMIMLNPVTLDYITVWHDIVNGLEIPSEVVRYWRFPQNNP